MDTSAMPLSLAQSNALRKVGIVLIVVVIIAMGSVLVPVFYRLRGSDGTIPSTQTVNIVNCLITVNAGGYEYYQIIVPLGASDVQVQGSFTASGGSGNGIVVLIMDTREFVNWQNSHQASAYYDSGQLTTSNFNVTLPSGSGTYYLVYSNTFSIGSQKNVNTQANLRYTS